MPEERRNIPKPDSLGRPVHGRPKVSIAAMANAKRSKDLGDTFKRILGYLDKQRGGLVAVLLLVAFSTSLKLIVPYLMQTAIDKCIVPKHLGSLAMISLALLLVYMTDVAVNLLASYSMIDAPQHTVKSMRNDLFAKVQSLPIKFFDLRPHGELMSRFTNDIENINTTSIRPLYNWSPVYSRSPV